MTMAERESLVVLACTAEEARELTDRIKLAVDGTWHLVKQAYESRAWSALGYSSWDDYCTREFGSSRLRLPREERQEVVASLRESGLSIRAIASATGTGKKQVQQALAQVSSERTPDEVSSPEQVARDLESPVVVHRPPPSVTGTDGKVYPIRPTAPEPAPKPRRSPLADDARNAGWQVRKAAERLVRIKADDRFAANKRQVTEELLGHLSYTIEVCQDLIDSLEEQ